MKKLKKFLHDLGWTVYLFIGNVIQILFIYLFLSFMLNNHDEWLISLYTMFTCNYTAINQTLKILFYIIVIIIVIGFARYLYLQHSQKQQMKGKRK